MFDWTETFWVIAVLVGSAVIAWFAGSIVGLALRPAARRAEWARLLIRHARLPFRVAIAVILATLTVALCGIFSVGQMWASEGTGHGLSA